MRQGIVIQARMGSSRYPGKVLEGFDHDRSLLEVVIARARENRGGAPVFVATTRDERDDRIAELCDRLDVGCLRGDVDDVLGRYCDAARAFELDGLVRVCADNPFLDVELMDALLLDGRQGRVDYSGYRVGATPAIKTHFGVFAEYVSVAALFRAEGMFPGNGCREHVTMCIYENPDLFEVAYRDVDAPWADRGDIRLTVDTRSDFETAREVYARAAMMSSPPTIEGALSVLRDRPDLVNRMLGEIEANVK